MPKVFIDGRAGTTGLQIDARLESRKDVTLLSAPEGQHRDPAVRKALLNEADFVFLCLPDDAAREAVSLIENPDTRVIDASTAHRTAYGWAYGLPELGKSFRRNIATGKRVSNPGCHATGFITLVRPLIQQGLLDPDCYLTAYSITGYTGGGKKMIADYEAENRDPVFNAPRQYALGLKHKHLPEMVAMSGMTTTPVFNPIAADFPRGMVVNVPFFMGMLTGIQNLNTIREAYADYYKGEQFIHVMPEGAPADGFLASNTVVGTNDLEIFVNGNDEQIVLSSRFDNLGKGASGAAIQNLNIMMGIDEKTGL